MMVLKSKDGAMQQHGVLKEPKKNIWKTLKKWRADVKMKPSILVKELRKRHDDLQQFFKKNIPKNKPKEWDNRCIWIELTCACGYVLKTPYWIKGTGNCSKCKKSFIRVLTAKEKKKYG